MNGKGRPEKLTDELKLRITKLQQGRKKKLKAPAIQEEIRLLLTAQIKEEHPAWQNGAVSANLEAKLPGVSRIQKYLKEIEDRDKPSSLDTPWHLGFMRKPEYGISAEALPYIFQVKEWCEKTKKETPITIRQAFWIAQFCHIHNKEMKDKERGDLWKTSWVYAHYEIVCELSGIDFDTTELDISSWYGGPAGPLLAAILSDLENGTRHMNSASEKLKGR